MYGTRGTAQNWDLEYSKMMTEAGATQGSHRACVFYNKGSGLREVVHGDDLTVLRSRSGRYWFRKVIQHRKEVKFKARLEEETRSNEDIE